MASKMGSRRWMLQLIMQLGSVLLTRCPFWGCFSQLMLYAERAEARRKPDIPVPYLYFDMGAAVLCASFMSFGVKRRWFALGAALQLAISTYAAYIGGYVHYGDWLKVRMYSRTVAIIGGFLVLASGAGELYRRKPRSRSLQSTGQVFLGIYLVCVRETSWSIQRSPSSKTSQTAGQEPRPGYKPHMKRTELRRPQPHLQQSSPSDSSGLPSPDHPASGAVAMMAGRRSWPAMAIVLLALLVCLGELVDADSKPQPSGEKASWEKHHFSLSHYAKLANRLVDPKLLGSFLSKRISDHANRPVK